MDEQDKRIDLDAETTDEVSSPSPKEARTQTDLGATSVAPPIRGKIGQYRLRSEIATGGMGTVYEAVQENPRRTVAVKVLKQGITSPSALRRFEYESQILARLRHPGIGQVYESGMHDDGAGGVPFFAMEYITGAKDLVAYAESKGLSTRDRLELFIKVCEAVHHGHQKGIIHRDLKPANILVDSSGQPKVIDFGVARATDSDLAVNTLQTQVGQLVGTVQFMSPEQIEADPHDIDTRSDVYELGVVLYNLLTNKMPYDVMNTPVYEATRVIKEQAPERPSSVVVELKGDVETIVLHALEKDRERRYQSAAAFAQDIRNYLENQPITARPPSLPYLLKTFTRRNKVLVGGMVAVFVCLVGGIIGTSVGMQRARESEAVAQKEATSAQAMTDYFEGMFASLNPREGAGPDTKVSEMLDQAAASIETELKDTPEVQARMHAALGTGYRGLTLHAEAGVQFQEALDKQIETLGPDDPVVAQTMIQLGASLYGQKHFERAAELFERSLKIREANFGPESLEVADSQNYLAAALNKLKQTGEAEDLYREALKIRQKLLPPRDELIARSLNNLGTCLLRQERFVEAEKNFQDAIDIVREQHGSRHIDIAGGNSNLGRCARGRGNYEEAEQYFGESLELKRRILRPDNDSIAITLGYLIEMLMEDTEDWPAAERHLQEMLAFQRLKFPGPSNEWRQAVTNSQLGECLARQDQFEEAESLLRDSYETLRDEKGRTDPVTQRTAARLEDLYMAWGKPEMAAAYR